MALLRAREAVMSEFRPMLRAYGLTEQQWRVLRVLVETGEVQISALAKKSFILMPSLSRILQSMESRALIERAPVARDQRRTLIRITADGRSLVAKVAPDAEQQYAVITEAVGAKNLDLLYSLLENVEAIDK